MNDSLSIFNQKKMEFGGYRGWGAGKSGSVFTTEPPVPFELDDVLAIEQKINATLPPSYRRFLLEIGAGQFGCLVQIRLEAVEPEPIPGFCFYGLEWQCNLWEVLNLPQGQLLDELAPIASVDPAISDHYCIGIRNHNYGKMYFWDHAHQEAVLISDSFEEFLEQLEECEEQ